MNILMMQDGFSDTQKDRKRDFFSELQKLKWTEVLYRGRTESGPFQKGRLLDFGETVTFETPFGSAVYPHYEVMIATASPLPSNPTANDERE